MNAGDCLGRFGFPTGSSPSFCSRSAPIDSQQLRAMSLIPLIRSSVHPSPATQICPALVLRRRWYPGVTFALHRSGSNCGQTGVRLDFRQIHRGAGLSMKSNLTPIPDGPGATQPPSATLCVAVPLSSPLRQMPFTRPGREAYVAAERASSAATRVVRRWSAIRSATAANAGVGPCHRSSSTSAKSGASVRSVASFLKSSATS